LYSIISSMPEIVEEGQLELEAYIEVISSFLGREVSPFLDEMSKLRLSSLKLSGLIVGINPIGDLVFGLRAHR
jgi:hypothetical protein